MLVDIPADATIGSVMMLDDQTFELAEIEPYRRKDGAASSLLVWRSECPTCGAVFEVKTGRGTSGMNRRCAEHRKVGKPVKGKRGRKVMVGFVPA